MVKCELLTKRFLLFSIFHQRKAIATAFKAAIYQKTAKI